MYASHEEPSGGHFTQLRECVIAASVAQSWNDAVLEWELIGAGEDESRESECVCGQKHIKRLFRIRNAKNGNILHPIGSSCIKRFGNKALSEHLRLFENFCGLMRDAAELGWNSWEVIGLDSGRYNKKLLAFMFERGAFVPTQYNHGCPHKDYQFMLSMLSKKSSRTAAQRRKEAAIIRHQIYPWMQEHYKSYCHDEPMDFKMFTHDCCYARYCVREAVDYRSYGYVPYGMMYWP